MGRILVVGGQDLGYGGRNHLAGVQERWRRAKTGGGDSREMKGGGGGPNRSVGVAGSWWWRRDEDRKNGTYLDVLLLSRDPLCPHCFALQLVSW